MMPFQTSQENIINGKSSERIDDNLKWNNLPWIKICMDILLFIIAAVPVHGFYVYDAIPYHRGFFCDDESIRYPYKGDTISNPVLYNVGYTVASMVILLNELFEMLKDRWQPYDTPSWKKSILVLAWKLYARIGVFLFGSYVNEIITNVTKVVLGRLRPFFLDVCRPNIDCSVKKNHYAYILNFTCTSNNTSKIENGRKSFPSGHASFGFYVMLFLVLYLQFCMTFKGNKLFKPSFQLIFLMIAWFTAMSRVSDYMHHWSDVLSGILLGSIIALCTVYFISDFAPRTGEINASSKSTTVEFQQEMPSYGTQSINSKL